MKWLARVWSLLASTWLAVGLVSALLLIAMAGTTIPQVAVTSPVALYRWQQGHALITWIAKPLGLFQAFSSPLFLVVLVGLAISLIACTLDRVARAVRRGMTIGAALGGSLVLHAGLLVLLAGGVASAGYKFSGTIVATEGQVIDLSQRMYVQLERGSLATGDPLPAMTIGLEAFKPAYRGTTPVVLDSTLVVQELGRPPARLMVSVNEPATFAGFTITQAGHGYSPNVTVRSPQGDTLVDAYVALRSLRAGGAAVYEDYIAPGGLGGRLLLRVYPDFDMRTRSPVSASFLPKNPVLQARLLDKRGATVAESFIEPNEEAILRGYKVGFNDLAYWSAFRVSRDPGVPILYASFGLCLLGLLLRYLPSSLPGTRKRDNSGDAQDGEVA